MNHFIGEEDDVVSSFEKFKAANGGVTGHIHITRDRDQIPLYQMDDSHLLNTIGIFSRNVENASQAHRTKASMLDVVMEKKAPGQKAVERLRALISDGYPLIGRYVLEASRRGLQEKAQDMAKPFYDTVSNLLGVDATGARIEIAGPAITDINIPDEE